MRFVRIALIVACSLTVAVAGRAADSVTYSYDDLGRISVVTYLNGTTITYTYDLAGNRLGQTVVCGSSGC